MVIFYLAQERFYFYFHFCNILLMFYMEDKLLTFMMIYACVPLTSHVSFLKRGVIQSRRKHSQAKRQIEKHSKSYLFHFFMLKVNCSYCFVKVYPNLLCRTLGTMFKLSVGEGFSECLCLICLYAMACMLFLLEKLKILKFLLELCFKCLGYAKFEKNEMLDCIGLKESCSVLVCF